MGRFQIHLASVNDILILVSHHRKMFEELWIQRNLELHEEKLKEMDEAYEQKLNEELAAGLCCAWIIKEKEKVIASGAISIVSMVPLPSDSTYRIAYLHSVYTEKDHRNTGLAGMIVKTAIEYCKAKQIKRMSLHASESGKSIYEKVGFEDSTNAMSISL